MSKHLEINPFLSNPWAKEDVSREITINFELNENANRTQKNLWGATKAVLRGRFIACNTNIRKEKRSHPQLSKLQP